MTEIPAGGGLASIIFRPQPDLKPSAPPKSSSTTEHSVAAPSPATEPSTGKGSDTEPAHPSTTESTTVKPTEPKSTNGNTEAVKAKETGVSAERQKEEIDFLGRMSIEGRINEMESRLEKVKPDDVEERGRILDEYPKWMHTYHEANDTFAPVAKEPDPVKQQEIIQKRLEKLYGEHITSDDGSGKLIKAELLPNGNVHCTLELPKGSKAVEITRSQFADQVHNSMLQSKKDEIINSLPEAERTAAQIYLDTQTKPDTALEGKSAEELNKAITESADSLGIPTKDTAKSCVENLYEFEKALITGDDKDAKIVQLEQEKQEVLAKLKLEEVNIADIKTIEELLKELGLRRGISGLQKSNLERSLQNAAKLKDNPDDTEKAKLQDEAKRIEIEKKYIIPRIADQLNTANLRNLAESTQADNVPVEVRRQFCQLLASGNSAGIVDFVANKVKSDSNEMADLKRLGRDHLFAMLEKSGGIAALIVLLMGYAGIKSETGGGGGGMGH